MNIRLWELDNGDLINLEYISRISVISGWFNLPDGDGNQIPYWGFYVYAQNSECFGANYNTEDEAKLARFKLVERWNACLDMIHNQTWCKEAGTYSSSRKPIKEDKFNGYRESEH